MSNMNSASKGKMVPEAKQYLDNMKYEIANELGVNLKQGYNGDLTSREAGYIGGYMVKNMCPERMLSLTRPDRTVLGHFRDVCYAYKISV